jgi:cell division protein ZapA
MAQVNVTISGRAYRMACDDGQEEHLTALARRLDETMEQLRGRFGDIDELRLAVMAAITLADQQADAERRLVDLEAENEGLRAGAAAFGGVSPQVGRVVAERLVAIASRIESLAERAAEAVDDEK